MQRLKTRLEALESRITTSAIGALTADDCRMLYDQIVLGNVRRDHTGRAVRAWRTGSAEYTAELDQALRRCNAMLATLDQPPESTGALERWVLRQLPYTPPAFDEALEHLDALLVAIADGRCAVQWPRYPDPAQPATAPTLLGVSAQCPAAERAELQQWCDVVSGYVNELESEKPRTTEDLAAWLQAHTRALAFFVSRSDAELDRFIAMEGTDPLFFDAEQRALADEWARLVEQGDDDGQNV